jgi:hydrogenase maturation protease HycI
MSNSLTAEVLDLLKPGQGLSLIITVGNPLRKDDGAGPYIASLIRPAGRLAVIDAQYNPENIIDEAARLKPVKMIIIDAADFGGSPGEARAIDRKHIPDSTLSTHSVPMSVVAGILEQDTGAEIVFLGIQPKDVSFGENISPEVRETADKIIKKINEEFCDA